MPYVNQQGQTQSAQNQAALNLVPPPSNFTPSPFSVGPKPTTTQQRPWSGNTSAAAGFGAELSPSLALQMNQYLNNMTLGFATDKLTSAFQTQINTYEKQKLGIETAGYGLTRANLKTQELYAQLEQQLKTGEYTLAQKTLTQQIATEKATYALQTQRLKSSAAARGASGALGTQEDVQRLTQTNQAKLATLYRQKQLTTIAQKLGQYQYQTAEKKLQTQTQQLALLAQRVGITQKELTAKLKHGIATLVGGGALTTAAYEAGTKAGVYATNIANLYGQMSQLGAGETIRSLLQYAGLATGTAGPTAFSATAGSNY
jgi:hypothetical protein